MASVRTEYLQAKSGKSSQSRQRETSSSHGSNQMPQSALRSGKYDTTNSKLNELKFDLSEIHEIYGYDASLYHVLSVNKNASSREIKAAYLNKGREILLAGSNSSEPSSGVSGRSRKKFQAASLAYEILSKEDLRALYDGRFSVARKNSVQWSKVVQEKVINDAHPDEHSRRKYSRRAPPPVYEDACTELDDEFDELMYYCNDDGGVKFIERDKLQELVDSFNTSMKMKRLHLLESFDTKFENERQPSEEVATMDGGDQRQLPAQSEDNDMIEMQSGGTEDATSPGNIREEANEIELDKSTVAIAVAATAVAAAVVEAKVEAADLSNVGFFTCGELEKVDNSDDKNDMIEAISIQEAPHSDDPAKKTSDSVPEEKTTNSKSKRTTKLRKTLVSRRKTQPQQDANTDEKSTIHVVSDEVVVAASDTGTGWFACWGASEAFANDDNEKVEGNNTVGNTEASEPATDAEDTVVDTNITAIADKATSKRAMPSMKLRNAMTSRRKSKSQHDTEDQEPSAEAGAVAVAVVAGAGAAGAGWFAWRGASEALEDDDDDDEVIVNKMVDKEETRVEGGRGVSEGGFAVESEETTKNKTRPSMKLRKAMTGRRKSKSQQDTDDQEPSAEAAAVGAGAGWFACCGASEAIASNNDGDMNKMEVVSVKLEKENGVDKEIDKDTEEDTTKNKTKPSMKMRNAMTSRNGDCGGRAEKKEANSKSTPSKKLIKTVSIRPRTKITEEKQSKNEKEGEEAEELAMPDLFWCCGASEAIPDNSEEIHTTKVETKHPKRLSNSARMLRNQLNIRKKTIKPLLDMDANDESNE